jgi:hypothetical protein
MNRTNAAREAESLRIEQERWERNLKLSVEERLNRGTVRPFRPGIDDGPSYRPWDTMADDKAWCATLPEWLGYGRPKDVEPADATENPSNNAASS